MDNINMHKSLNKQLIKHSFLWFSILLLLGSSFYASAAKNTAMEMDENQKIKPITAIEILINKRITETVLLDNRPAHVYRPRTPIFHYYHPENVPTPPVIKKYLLVDHPELNNNQGRNQRAKKITINPIKKPLYTTP